MMTRMAYNILKDVPKCWTTESIGLKPEYAEQLVENGLIEEVEPGRYRLTQDGTHFAVSHTYDPPSKEMCDFCHFTVQEPDITSDYYRNRIPKSDGTYYTEEELRAFIGKPAP